MKFIACIYFRYKSQRIRPRESSKKLCISTILVLSLIRLVIRSLDYDVRFTKYIPVNNSERLYLVNPIH